MHKPSDLFSPAPARRAFTVRSVGRVENGVTDTARGCWEEVVSTLRPHPDFADGLRGLERYSHLMVVCRLDGAEFRPEDLVAHPFQERNLPEVGVFARRGRDRPNKLGVSTVRILEVTDDAVTVRGLDAVHGTPILDLKAFDPVYDAHAPARIPDWLAENTDRYSGE